MQIDGDTRKFAVDNTRGIVGEKPYLGMTAISRSLGHSRLLTIKVPHRGDHLSKRSRSLASIT